MFAIFRKRWFLRLLAICFIAIAIWYIGPYIAVGDYKPFESTFGRLLALSMVVLFWGGSILLSRLRNQHSGGQLAKAVARQEDPAAARNSGEARQLQQRFEEAVTTLQKTKKGRVNLYDLPWYIIIGPPGSGKTTAIVNSGLNFPLAQKFGKEALRGVGGTRNCDWWFTDQAILLDTAGRYTTQDSDQNADASAWIEFLALLRKYRKRRPINGVLIAISLAEIITHSEVDRHRNVGAIRQRLEELQQHLRITVPVYLLLTKADLLAGFEEFFDDLQQEGRSQVLGTTYLLEQSRSGAVAGEFVREFDRIVERLQARMMLRLESERDVQRRSLIFGFPHQFAGARRALSEFVGELFEKSGFNEHILFRGVYFTSGTQEGTPIDRILGTLARTFGLGMKALAPQSGRGRAYFIRQFLTDVLFKETGLAGLNRRTEVLEAAAQTGAYTAVAVVTLLGLIALSVSYARNQAYLQTVRAAVAPLSTMQSVGEARIPDDLPRLDGMRNALSAAEKYKEHAPVMMRAGLYQGGSMTHAVEDAYSQELNATFLPAVAQQFQERLPELAAEPDKLYEYLKAYLMLGEVKRIDAVQLSSVADVEWGRLFADDPGLRDRLAAHLKFAVSDLDRIQPVTLDTQVIEQARKSLLAATLPVLMFSHLQLEHAGDTANAINLQIELGLGGVSVFVRRGGTPLSKPIPALYTRKVFDSVVDTGKDEVVKAFVSDNWVLGKGVASIADAPRLSNELMRVYEDAYIKEWDSVLADLEPKATSGSKGLSDMMGLIASDSSPLRRLLILVEANTNLLKPLANVDALDKAKAAIAAKKATLTQIFGQAPVIEKPGTRVTRHFEPLHRLVNGPAGAAPIDQTLHVIGQIQQQLANMGGGLGGTNALEAVTTQGQADALGRLRLEAMQLPAPISTMVAKIGSKGEALAKGEAGRELANRYQTEVASECRQLISGRYPFDAASTVDVALADFGHVFGFGGLFDNFFKDRLSKLVDNSVSPWRWREGAGAIGGSMVLLNQFQAADRIRQIYFRPGSQLPELHFSLTVDTLDASVRRLAVEIDGQSLEYRHGPIRTVSMVWPGPSPGQTSILFEESGGAGPNRSYKGPWGLFRLLDEANVTPQSDVKYLIALHTDGRAANVSVEATSVRNPFARNELRGFHCGG